MTTFDNYPNFLLALTIYREARGEPHAGKVAIKHVILNRVACPKGPYAHCKTIVETILAPYQFSTFNHDPKDSNTYSFPTPTSPEWLRWIECCEVVDSMTTDPTNGANAYFRIGTHTDWDDPKKHTVQIGKHVFLKL